MDKVQVEEMDMKFENQNGGGSYGGLGSGGLNGGLPGVIYGDKNITFLVGGSGGGHSLSGSGNAGGGGGAVGFDVNGTFTLDSNSTISVRGGNGLVDGDASGAGGSGGAIRIKARGGIINEGILDARGGDAVGNSTLAGAGGGGRVSLLTPLNLIEGQVFVDGGESVITFDDIYRQDDLVAYWTLDDLNSSDVAVNQTGNDLLDGNITGQPVRVSGIKNGAFAFDGIDDRIIVNFSNNLLLDKYTVSLWLYPKRNTGSDFSCLFGRSGRNYVIMLGNSDDPNFPYLHHRFGEGFNLRIRV